MRITVSIDERDLKQVMRLTRQKRKSAAVNAGIKELLRREKVAEVVRLVREGKIDYGSTNEEVERSDADACR